VNEWKQSLTSAINEPIAPHPKTNLVLLNRMERVLKPAPVKRAPDGLSISCQELRCFKSQQLQSPESSRFNLERTWGAGKLGVAEIGSAACLPSEVEQSGAWRNGKDRQRMCIPLPVWAGSRRQGCLRQYQVYIYRCLLLK